MARPKINLADFDAMLNFDSKEEAVPAPQGHIPGTELVHNGILEMDFSQMEPFPEHKFKLYEGQQLNDMVESIRQFGILLPIILWHTGEGK